MCFLLWDGALVCALFCGMVHSGRISTHGVVGQWFALSLSKRSFTIICLMPYNRK